MCDVSKNRFFRPWNGASSVDRDESPRVPSVKCEPEEDNVSVLSSESEINPQSVSSCSSTASEDLPETGSLDMLSNFVFSSTQDNQTQSNADESVTGRSSSSSSSSVSNNSPSAFTPTCSIYPDYFSPFRGSCDSAAAQFDAYHPQIYGYGLHVPLGAYPSMEDAVKLIHQQDIAAKQMKKLRPKKFRCEHCDVAFSNNGQLKGHIRIHTGERPFKCDADNCGKSFTRNEELTRHKRIHTGLRPHSCLVCGKKFGRKDHLKKHTRTHDNRGPYHLPGLGAFGLGHISPHPMTPYLYPI